MFPSNSTISISEAACSYNLSPQPHSALHSAPIVARQGPTQPRKWQDVHVLLQPLFAMVFIINITSMFGRVEQKDLHLALETIGSTTISIRLSIAALRLPSFFP